MTRGTHHRATPVCTAPPGPDYCSCRMLPSHASVACSCRITAIADRATVSPALYYAQPPNPTFLPHHPVRATPISPALAPGFPLPSLPEPDPVNRARTERNPLIRGKPFLTASHPSADYAELPTARTSPERIEGVSRSLPYSDLLALTSSHMFFSVMN